MRKLKIYLETTLFNYYFEPERDAYPYVQRLFDEISSGKWDAYTSDYVIDELRNAPEYKREQMLALIKSSVIGLLPANEESIEFMTILMDFKAIPQSSINDGLHIASAITNDMDMIISLNFSHIVRHKTIERAELAAMQNGYRPIKIYSPMEVTDNGEDV